MKIGMTAGAYHPDLRVFLEEIKILKKHGFDCIDYQGFLETTAELFELSDEAFDAYLLEQKRMLAEVGLSISQVHGPWRWPAQDATEEDRAERFEKMAKALRGTAVLGCRYFVIHNLMPYGRVDEDRDVVMSINRSFFAALAEVAQQHGVVICLENMPFADQYLARPRDMLAFVKELNHDSIRMCLDTGHCTRVGVSAAEAVRLLGTEYLRVMHVHDNDGEKDRHWYPFEGKTDWRAFAEALREIGFDGTLSIESKVEKGLSLEQYDLEIRKLANCARNILA